MLKLNKKIYSKKAIRLSQKTYHRYAKVALKEKNQYYCISFPGAAQRQIRFLEREFANLVLALTKKYR